MKRFLTVLLVLVLVLSMAACGKSEAAKAADEMIAALGTITLDSGSAIAAAEKAVAALTQEEKDSLDNTAVLTEARATYDTLVAEKEAREAAEREAKRIEELKQKAAEVDALIDAIGEVTLDSGDVITKARAAYDACDDELKTYVTKLDALEAAEDTLGNMKAEVVINLIDVIGEVTKDSGEKIREAQDAFDALSVADQARVTNAAVLKDAAAALKAIRVEAANAKLAKMTKEEDFVNSTTFYFPKGFPYYHAYNYWGADVRCFALPYMGVSKNQVWMRLVCDYTSHDWVFFEKVIFAVDDQRFTKYFDYFDVVRDNGWGKVWEYVDIAVGESELEMLEAIANSDVTVIRFEGDDYFRDFTVSASDKQIIREMLDIYYALS